MILSDEEKRNRVELTSVNPYTYELESYTLPKKVVDTWSYLTYDQIGLTPDEFLDMLKSNDTDTMNKFLKQFKPTSGA